MVNSNRWSWSGAPRKSRVPEDAVISSEPLISPSVDPDSSENGVPADKKLLQPGAAGVSSRRRTNRWSWRPDATISVTVEDQQENEQEVGQPSPSEAARPVTSSGPRRLSKLNKKPNAASTKRPRPLSMIAPASSSFGAAPSFSHLQQQQQEQQQETGDESSSQPSPLPAEPSIGVKVLNRFLSRRFSKRQPKSPRAQETEPMPPLSPPHQQEQTSTAKPMQSPMRSGPQLHNPQNTLRGTSPANPATPAQGRIDNGRMGAPLPGLDEQSELQLPAPDIPPVSTANAATSLGPVTTSSSTPAPSADETGILGRLRRRRMAPKDKDTDNNKKRWMSTGGDKTKSQPAGADDLTNTNSSDPAHNIDETNDTEMQAQSLLLPASHASQKKLNDKSSKTQDGQPVSDTRSPPSKSVPRFLRQVVRPQQATSPTQAPGAVTPHDSKPRSQSHPQTQSKQHMPASTPAAQPKVRTKPSLGKRFWSKSGANDFGDDDTKTDAPGAAPVVRPIYVPKHAAADFSRTTHPPRQQRQSISIANGDDSIRPLATISTQAIEDELQYREQRTRTLSAEKEAEKRKSRDMSSSKYGAPSPQELHRRLEIVKSSEIEVITTREPVLEAWSQLHGESYISSANGKGLARSHSQSRPRSSQRHSFNLIADPYARDLTPPKSVSPVEMEAPFDPPSQSSRHTPEQSPQSASRQTPEKPKAYKPTHAAESSRPRYQPEEKPRKDMSDFERFIAEAEAADRNYHAQMWSNLARRSGHYGFADNTFGSFRPDPVSLNPGVVLNTQQSSKRDSAYYSTNKRASVMSAPAEDELKRQASISKRFSDYIKPPKPSLDAAKDDWMATGRANRRSVIAGVAEE